MYAFMLSAAGAIGRVLARWHAPEGPQAEAGSEEPEAASPRLQGPAPAGSDWTTGTLTWLLTAGWTAMGVLAWVLFPMLSVVLLPLCTVAPLGWCWATRRVLPWYGPSPTILVLVLATGFLLVNAAWSRSPDLAARAVALMIILVGTLHVVLNILPSLDERPLRAMAVGALAGLATAGAFLCLEVFSDQSLRRALMRLVPALQPNPHHMAMESGQIARLAPYLPNASIAVLTLMLSPAVLLAVRLGLTRRLTLAALAAAVVAVAAILASEHASSQAALAGAAVVLALHRLWPKVAMRVLIVGWIVASLAVVPVAWLLFSVDAHRAEWLPHSFRHRVVIWRHTAERIPDAPLLGAGVGTGRALHEARQEWQREVLLAPGTRFELSTGLHSHNAYLQVWYETGAVGAAMVLVLGLTILWGLRALSTAAQPLLGATFAACALLVASAYSVWAAWFMATLAMTAIFAALGAALTPPRKTERTYWD